MTDIFSSVQLGDIRLPNRIVMAPMTRCRAGSQDEPTDLVVDYYRQRASAGLIISEGVQPSIHGKGYYRTPGIHSALQIERWRAVNDSLKAAGGRMVMQLMHCGRASVAANKDPDAETVAPSAIASRNPIYTINGMTNCEVPRALETAEIAGVVEEFATACRNAVEAGFDGIELHATSGYLPMQFLSTGTNRRTDRYGGSPANRARFVIEALEAMAAAVGPGRIGLRISPANPFNDITDDEAADTYSHLLRSVDGLGLAYVHIIDLPTPGIDPLPFVRANWSGPVIANNDLTFESARRILADGRADAVSFGRYFVSNPDLVERFRTGAPLAPVDRQTLYAGEARGFTDYPTYAEALKISA